MRIKRRVGLPRMRFHVMNRGARRVATFRDDEDRALFVDLLGWTSRKHQIPICAWCLMPNHFHIQTCADGTSLIRLMHDLTGAYARKFNKKHRASGHLFQGRFRSTAVLDDAGFAYVNRYIHLNPVDLGIRARDYRWSSCRAYLGLDPTPAWLDRWTLFGSADPDVPSTSDEYALYLEAAPPRRRRKTLPENRLEDALLDLVERRCLDWLLRFGDDHPAVRPDTLVGYVAQRLCKIPSPQVARFVGAVSPGALRVATTRFQQEIESDEGLARDLGALRPPAYRCA